MEITILADHDLEGFDVFIEAGLKETGWDQIFKAEFKRLRDYGLPDHYPDQEIWRFVQTQGLLLITNNRNNAGADSLEATIQRENTLASLPVITVSDKDALAQAAYRQRVAESLAAVILYLDDYRGAGRLFVP